MIIVVDSNIIISALIKDSFIRKLIYEIWEELILPELVLEEIKSHNEEEIDNALKLILKNMRIIPDEIIKPFIKEAYEIIGKVDEKDVLFVACALAHSESVIWSDDKDFEQQNKILVLKTKDVKNLINSY